MTPTKKTTKEKVAEAAEMRTQDEITPENLCFMLKQQGVDFILEDNALVGRERIDIANELQLDNDLNFSFKEMKVNVFFQHIFSCSLDVKIKANCDYKAFLYLNPETWNINIGQVYYGIEKEIKETIEEIKKGGMFNTIGWYQSKIETIVVSYKKGLKDIEAIKNSYREEVKVKPNFLFNCNVMKVENNFESVKRVDFCLGIEAFVKLAKYGKTLQDYKLGLIED